MVACIHIRLQDHSYAEQLCQSLRADPAFADCRIVCGGRGEETGDAGKGVRVIDLARLPKLQRPWSRPAKTVLIASGAVDLEQVWEAGIVSVLQHSESLEQVKLAILAALLRPAESHRP